MSASLVGSEMCIRDRHGRRRAVDGIPPSQIKELLIPGLAIHSSVPAVSYTHLTLPTICSV
eukprot:316850-Alexandrium_andersonii.AAC.1